MSDPIAEAAAQQQNDPSLLEKAMDTIHSLEAKVEHLMHPETPGNADSSASTAEMNSTPMESTTNAPAVGTPPTSETSPETTSVIGEAGNAVPAADAGAPEAGDAPAAGGDFGIVGLVDHAASIRSHIAAIKQHLSLRGFELSLVADIHAELAAIESHL